MNLFEILEAHHEDSTDVREEICHECWTRIDPANPNAPKIDHYQAVMMIVSSGHAKSRFQIAKPNEYAQFWNAVGEFQKLWMDMAKNGNNGKILYGIGGGLIDHNTDLDPPEEEWEVDREP